jgi:hypothetical protein
LTWKRYLLVQDDHASQHLTAQLMRGVAGLPPPPEHPPEVLNHAVDEELWLGRQQRLGLRVQSAALQDLALEVDQRGDGAQQLCVV